MRSEAFFDRWTPETPVKVTWSGEEPESYLSLADAGRRLERLSDHAMDPDMVQRHLVAGHRFTTPFATYELVSAVLA